MNAAAAAETCEHRKGSINILLLLFLFTEFATEMKRRDILKPISMPVKCYVQIPCPSDELWISWRDIVSASASCAALSLLNGTSLDSNGAIAETYA